MKDEDRINEISLIRSLTIPELSESATRALNVLNAEATPAARDRISFQKGKNDLFTLWHMQSLEEDNQSLQYNAIIREMEEQLLHVFKMDEYPTLELFLTVMKYARAQELEWVDFRKENVTKNFLYLAIAVYFEDVLQNNSNSNIDLEDEESLFELSDNLQEQLKQMEELLNANSNAINFQLNIHGQLGIYFSIEVNYEDMDCFEEGELDNFENNMITVINQMKELIINY